MTRKTIDCAAQPNEVGCTLMISGEQDEVVAAAALHAVTTHGHDDSPELRDYLRGALTDEPAPSRAGAFVQLIQFQTERIDEVDAVIREWATAIGGDRTARWAITGADRDHPHSYVQIVEFPDYASAMANSAHPVTNRFAERLAKLCDGPARFTNLDVHGTDVGHGQ